MWLTNKYWYWGVVVIVLVANITSQGLLCYGCSSHERTALLQLKSHLPHLCSWGRDDDCCTWDGVICNPITNRVSELIISGKSRSAYRAITDRGPAISGKRAESYLTTCSLGDYERRYLNASLFLPFHELINLDLSNNDIAGCVENGGFETLSKLENLESLDLSYNSFNNSILSSLVGLSLKDLNLRYNAIKGSINMTELNALNHLEELHLSGNEIIKFESSKGIKSFSNLIALYLDGLVNNVTNKLLESLGEFHNLKNLSLESNDLTGAMFRHPRYSLIELSLSDCYLDENFLQSLELLPSLKVLDILYIQTGLSTSQGFPHLKNLERLDLSNSALDNKIVPSIGNLTSLQYLNLADCGLSGHIAQSLCALKDLRELYMRNNYLIRTLPHCMENLTSLQKLDLSSNNLSGNIYFSPLKSLIYLESLILSNNHFQIPLSFSPFFNHSKLKSFDASENEVYNRREMHNLIPKFQLQSLSLSCYGNGESFPQFLYHQRDLQKVDISHVRMKERFPHWLLQNNTNLESLDLRNTSLLGFLELPIQCYTNLWSLDISDNKLFGRIPSKIGACFSRLRSLNMSSNNFSGSIPSSLGNVNMLDLLDLSNNGLSGKLPDLLIKGCQKLSILKLSNNKLQGQMFPGNAFLTSLMWFQLDGNQFTGSIPNSLSESSSLYVLDVSHNNLSGGIPQWIIKMTNLQVLDLSHNKLDGILLPKLFPPSISLLYLSNNRLQGSMPNEFDCTKMVVIDLSQNNLTGGIPKWLGRCSYLGYLLLKGNNFEREIPKQLCKLNKLSLIDLSSNYLCGRIPSCLRIGVNN